MVYTAGLVYLVQPQNTLLLSEHHSELSQFCYLNYWIYWSLLVLPFQESVFQLWPLFPQSFLLFVPLFFLWCHQSPHPLQCVHSKQNFINKSNVHWKNEDSKKSLFNWGFCVRANYQALLLSKKAVWGCPCWIEWTNWHINYSTYIQLFFCWFWWSVRYNQATRIIIGIIQNNSVVYPEI